MNQNAQAENQSQPQQSWHPRQGPLAKLIAGLLLLVILGGIVAMAAYAW